MVVQIKHSIIILYSAIQIAQKDSLKFTLYDKDECDGSCSYSLLYFFKDKISGKVYRPKSKTGICLLPDTGTYKLYYLGIEYPLTYKFKGQQTDTLNVPALYYGYPGVDDPQPGGWVFCKEIANGKMVDYYKPGLKRLEGKFRNGKVVGKLRYYDLDGKVRNVPPDKGLGWTHWNE